MTAVALKHARDVLGFLTGSGEFGLNESALDGWAYPLDLAFTLEDEERYYSPRDAAGLPVRRYRSAGVQYNPTRLAAYALAHFNRYLATGDEESRARFRKAAEWFLSPEDGVWRYEFDWNDLEAPWSSCMAQGEGISVLVRAHHLTGDERWLAQARRAAAPLAVPLAEGGLRSRLPGGGDFLEEYPSPDPAHVLNGFLYALIGIADLARVDPSIRSDVGFEDLLDSLERDVERWDLGYWSAYDLDVGPAGVRNAATVSYHRLHVAQLRFLGRALGRARYLEVADRWESRLSSPAGRMRALASKLLYRSMVRAQR